MDAVRGGAPAVAIRVPSFRMVLYTRFKDMDEKTFFEEEADVRPLRKHFYRRMGGARGFSDEDVAAALEELDLSLSRMEKLLAGAMADGKELHSRRYYRHSHYRPDERPRAEHHVGTAISPGADMV